MNWADWVILAIVAISSLISLKRGFVKEALSLANWVVAFFIAMMFYEPFASMLSPYIGTPSVRDMVAFAALFAATLIVGAMLNNLVGELVRITGLSGTDRAIGMVFGLLRGFVIVMAILLLVPLLIPIDEDVWWKKSTLIPHFLEMEGWTRQITADIAGMFSKVLS